MELFSPAGLAPAPFAPARLGDAEGGGGAAPSLAATGLDAWLEVWLEAEDGAALATKGEDASATSPERRAPMRRLTTVWPSSCLTSTSRPPSAPPASGWSGHMRRGTWSRTCDSWGNRLAALAAGESPQGVLSKRRGPSSSSASGLWGSSRLAAQVWAVQAPALQVWAPNGSCSKSSPQGWQDTSRNVFLTVTLRSSPPSEADVLEQPEKLTRRPAERPGGPSAAASNENIGEPRLAMGRVVKDSGMGSSIDRAWTSERWASLGK